MITKAQQQRNATATQLDPSDFFVRRLKVYERTLSVLTTRIEESYAQEINLIAYLHLLPCILNELRYSPKRKIEQNTSLFHMDTCITFTLTFRCYRKAILNAITIDYNLMEVHEVPQC